MLNIHLNDITDIDGQFILGNQILTGEYFTAHDIKINNSNLHFIFDSIVYKIDTVPRNKVFLKLTDTYLEKYRFLINKIQSDINEDVNDYDTVFNGRSSYLTPRLPGGTVNNETVIFTKIYKLINNNPVKIEITDLPNKFKGLFTVKLRSVSTSNTVERPKYLILEITEILITEIIENTVINKIPSSFKYLNYLQ
jgi:hypothetical protein